MRKRFYLLLFLVFITGTITAQSGDIMVMGASPDLYLVHKVAPKENWYSVGRLYNISPKEIAPVNGINIDKSLTIGQQIKVPLTAGNFSQNGEKASDEIYVPVYHIVQDKEWLFRISTNYNKVPIENLEKWNNISKNDAKAGMKLIIGYLKVKRDLSALASKGVSTVKAGTAPVKTTLPETTASQAPVTKVPDATTPDKKTEPIVKQENKVERQVSAPVEEKPVVANNPVAHQAVINSNSSSGAGYFKTLYEPSGKSVSGAAGVFKSTSGWQDGKYYALMNNVAIGTIIKINNPVNNKTVFAKVLGQLPEMKESVGLTTRVSDAAASELGTADLRFSVEVKY